MSIGRSARSSRRAARSVHGSAHRSVLRAAAVAAAVASVVAVLPARGQSPATYAAVAPTNDLPNPYRTVEGWAKLGPGRTWGATSAVEVDRDGRRVWVAERCAANSCATSDLPSVLLFDAGGTLVRAFGAGLLLSPHGITVDAEGNVWVTDCACTGARRPAGDSTAATRGHQVFKFAPDGRVLMTLGAPGGARGDGFFWQPNDVLVAPDGSIFVAEGHTSSAGSTARVLKLSSDGTLLRSWGTWGKGDGQLDQPHALAMDSRGRLFVGDRGNDRILIYDQDGTLLDSWSQFGRPSGIAIDAHDTIYVADSESGSVAPAHGAWKRGIRIGSARDGRVTGFIPDPNEKAPSTSAAEGVAVDARGVIYGAEVGPRALKRYERR